jgi:hypothetical protein
VCVAVAVAVVAVMGSAGHIWAGGVKGAPASPMDDMHVAVAGSWGVSWRTCRFGPGADPVLSKETLQFAWHWSWTSCSSTKIYIDSIWTIFLLFSPSALIEVDVEVKDSRQHVQKERIRSWTGPRRILPAIRPNPFASLSLPLPTNSLPQYHDPPKRATSI